jgi:tripartite-type tricarboxylate transporter receptor subunit TctC
MKIPRRALLCLVANTAALTTVPRIAGAQTYPSRPVRIIVGFAAGRGSDITARLIGQSLSERLASNASLRIDRGRNTLLLASVEGAVNVTLYERLNCNFIRDIAAVAGIIRAPYVILVNPSFPAKTVREFIAYARASTAERRAGRRVRETGAREARARVPEYGAYSVTRQLWLGLRDLRRKAR